MAESSWPSPSNSRTVDDTQFEKLGIGFGPLGGVIGDFTNPQLIYGDSTGLQIKVAADRYALVRGHGWWSGSSIVTKAITSNSSGSTRVDLVVLRLSRTTWDVTCTIINGTPGAGAPSPTQNTGTTGSWDLPLATVTVANNASTISAANVTYVAPHLDSAGNYRTPSLSTLAYIPEPTAHMIARLSTGDEWKYQNSMWVPNRLWRRKPANTSRASNTSTTADPDLQFPSLPASSYYILRGIISYTADAAADMRGGLFGSSGALFRGAHLTAPSSVSGTQGSAAWDSTDLTTGFVFGGNGASTLAAHIDGVYYSGTGGTVGFHWAQWVSNATATVVLANSYLELTALPS